MTEISLIPKAQKEKTGAESIFSKLGIIVLILFVASILIYGGLFFYNKSLESNLYELQQEIKIVDEQRDIEFEKELIPLEKTLKDLKTILKDHLFWSDLLIKFEGLVVPQVTFLDFSGGLDESGSINLDLNGRTLAYTYLAKQMVSFANENLISDVELSVIKLGTEGGIEFEISINFKKDILLK